MCGERSACLLAEPGDDVDHAFGNAGFEAQLGQPQSAVRGVCSAGLSTTVLPNASAGATFHAAMIRGKFQGMMPPHTPSGSRSE